MKHPTYTTSLPPQIRFSRHIPANAKLLYGEIKALCDQQGYCWASNHYFAQLYGVEKKAISRWIHQLETQGYLRLEAGQDKGNQRRIYLKDYPPQRDEVSSEKGGGHPISEGGYPPKKTGEESLLLIDNFIDNNYRIHSASSPEGKAISRDRGKAFKAEENDLDRGGSDSQSFGDQRPDIPHPPVALTPLPPPEEQATGMPAAGVPATGTPVAGVPVTPKFAKPSVVEVETYMLEQPELCTTRIVARDQALRFVNYYESNGWKVGRNAMQDWQAAANNWLLNVQTYQSSKPAHHENPRTHLSSGGSKDYSIPL